MDMPTITVKPGDILEVCRIAKEDPREPLTDIQIAELLQKEMMIKVARRTIAKYREALNLLPSNKRKQMF